MHSVVNRVSRCVGVLFAGFVITVPAWTAEVMAPVQQTALVQKYCAVCHTDAVKNGGLSLQHYDAAAPNPALAAMLLSKLNSGAMGAAGVGIPDEATGKAWIAVTAAQAAQAKSWTVIHETAPVVTASIVREVSPRDPKSVPPLYRLTVGCNTLSHQGEMQLTWSPQPQVDRTFLVSVDGNPGIAHKLEGREEKMGNGVAARTGLASAMLTSALPARTLTVTDLFPGETIVFPIADLDPAARRALGACFTSTP